MASSASEPMPTRLPAVASRRSNRLASARRSRSRAPRWLTDAVGPLETMELHLAAPRVDVASEADSGSRATSGYWKQALVDAIAALRDPDARAGRTRRRARRAWRSRASQLADAMRFEFLYDRRRRMFSIGYRLADAEGPGALDGSFYDLLASEARLASFVAIAKGDVPQHHWFHLGRLVTSIDGRATLMSWGGTDVRVPDAAAADAELPGNAPRSELPREHPPADRVRPASASAVGNLGVGVRRCAIARETISTRRSASPGSD